MPADCQDTKLLIFLLFLFGKARFLPVSTGAIGQREKF